MAAWCGVVCESLPHISGMVDWQGTGAQTLDMWVRIPLPELMSIFYLPPPSDVNGRTVIDRHNLILNDEPLFGGVIRVRLKRNNFNISLDPDDNPIALRNKRWEWHGTMTSHWYEMPEFGVARDRLFANLAGMFTIGRFGRGCVSQALLEVGYKWGFGLDEWDRWVKMQIPQARFLIDFHGHDSLTIHDDMQWE